MIEFTKARAFFYSFLNIHFMQVPDVDFINGLRNPAFLAVLEDLNLRHDGNPEITHGGALMADFLESTMHLEDADFADQLGMDRTRLYHGISPKTGPVPPFEAFWIEAENDTSVLQDIVVSYAQGGFAMKGNAHKRPDYIGMEMNYLEMLVNKEARARQEGNWERVHMVSSLEKEFMVKHLGRWAAKFTSSALGFAGTGFYQGHLHILKGFLDQEKDMLLSGHGRG